MFTCPFIVISGWRPGHWNSNKMCLTSYGSKPEKLESIALETRVTTMINIKQVLWESLTYLQGSLLSYHGIQAFLGYSPVLWLIFLLFLLCKIHHDQVSIAIIAQWTSMVLFQEQITLMARQELLINGAKTESENSWSN